MKHSIRHTAFLLLLVLLSCRKEDMGRAPMSFGVDDDVYTWTKAGDLYTATGHSSMKVWASRIEGGNVSTLMGGYVVNYSSSDEWRYDNVSGQSICYWDMNADAFRFHTGAPASAVAAIAAGSMTLSLAATDSLGSTALYSAPKVVDSKSEFGKDVVISFKHAQSRLCLEFVNGGTAAMDVQQAQLVPSQSYSKTGDLVVSYDWTSSPASVSLGTVSNAVQSTQALAFGSVSVPLSATVASSTIWYMLPEANSDQVSASKWKVSAKVNGTDRLSGEFSQVKQFRPGYSYTYKCTLKDDGIYLLGVIETINNGDSSGWLN